MVGIILASHGGMAKGMLESAQMIMGELEQVQALALNPQDDPLSLAEKMKEAAKAVDTGDGVILLVDLMGGSPSNASAYLAKDGVPVITGMSLPMLLELLGMRFEFSESLIEHVMEAGKSGIMDIRTILGVK